MIPAFNWSKVVVCMEVMRYNDGTMTTKVKVVT